MAFPNQNGGNQPVNGTTSFTNQQLSALLNLLGQQQQANPASSSFNPNYFSQLMNLANQVTTNPQPQTPVPVQPSPTGNYVIVRPVPDSSVIEAQEVSMGVTNLFPSTDGQRIFGKTWNKEGLIETSVYEKVVNNPVNPGNDISVEDLEKRVKALELSVSKLKKQKAAKPKPKPAPKSSSPVTKVDVVEEETDDE